MSTKALIFNIQKFSLHDGPGIRTTVFFKGCPLSCAWCHNIESQAFSKEPMLRGDLCAGCASCMDRCPEGAIELSAQKAQTDLEICTSCGRCVMFCPRNGRQICGEQLSVDEVLGEVLKDQVFYERSGGGVTCSGGEAMAQIDFLAELLSACKKQRLHSAVDTSGYVPWTSFERILPLTDLFLYDLKIMDEQTHRQYTGVSNSLILENLERLSEAAARIWIRFPVIPTVNDGAANIEQTIAFLRRISIEQINLLPYHALGRGKASQLGRNDRWENLQAPGEKMMKTIQRRFADAGFKAVIGG